MAGATPPHRRQGHREWQEIAAQPEEISSRLAPYARSAVGWFLSLVGGIAGLLVQFLLVVAVAALLYARGEGFADFVRRFAVRLAGERGDRSVHLAGQAIRAVALGIVVTALVQAVLAGIGLAVTGVPFAAVLTAAILLLSIGRARPDARARARRRMALLDGRGRVGNGAAGVDTRRRDHRQRAAAHSDSEGRRPAASLIIAGVIGGLIGFGIVGIFIGPVVLAVTYTLLVDWVHSGEHSVDAPPP